MKESIDNILMFAAQLISDEQLIVMTLDFLTPSLVANSVAVTQVLQALCAFPNVQKKVQDEIDHVVGQGCLPALDDRIK